MTDDTVNFVSWGKFAQAVRIEVVAEERSALEKRLLHSNGSPKLLGSQSCPYFGLPDDPQTRLLMPGEGGFCHKASFPEPVRFEHQYTHCLSADHVNCPVFARERIGALPSEIGRNRRPRRTRGRWWLSLLLILIVSGGVVTAMLWQNGRVPTEPTATANDGSAELDDSVIAVISTTVTVTASPTSTPSATPTATPTHTPLPPTATPQATIPPTFTPQPTDTPIPLMTPTPQPVLAQLNEPFVNARIGPDESFPSVQLLQQTDNQQFEVIGQSDDGGWWLVCCVTEEPVWLSIVTVDVAGETTAVPIINSPPPSILVNVETLNARAFPDTEADIVVELTNGSQLTVTGQYFGWYQVCCVEGETSAWVFAESVTLQGRVQDIPEIAVP